MSRFSLPLLIILFLLPAATRGKGGAEVGRRRLRRTRQSPYGRRNRRRLQEPEERFVDAGSTTVLVLPPDFENDFEAIPVSNVGVGGVSKGKGKGGKAEGVLGKLSTSSLLDEEATTPISTPYQPNTGWSASISITSSNGVSTPLGVQTGSPGGSNGGQGSVSISVTTNAPATSGFTTPLPVPVDGAITITTNYPATSGFSTPIPVPVDGAITITTNYPVTSGISTPLPAPVDGAITITTNYPVNSGFSTPLPAPVAAPFINSAVAPAPTGTQVLGGTVTVPLDTPATFSTSTAPAEPVNVPISSAIPAQNPTGSQVLGGTVTVPLDTPASERVNGPVSSAISAPAPTPKETVIDTFTSPGSRSTFVTEGAHISPDHCLNGSWYNGKETQQDSKPCTATQNQCNQAAGECCLAAFCFCGNPNGDFQSKCVPNYDTVLLQATNP